MGERERVAGCGFSLACVSAVSTKGTLSRNKGKGVNLRKALIVPFLASIGRYRFCYLPKPTNPNTTTRI